MKRHSFALLGALFLLIGQPVHAGWKAGAARIGITPDQPLWMAGYAARTEPARGTALDLHAKALALEDDQGNRLVLVTLDLLGFSAPFIAEVSNRIQERTGLERRQIFFNASHTHSGPALTGVLEIAYSMNAQQQRAVADYTDELGRRLADLVAAALGNLEPARLHFGRATASFAVNRRVETPHGFVIGANRQGPVDHEVPILAVDSEAGELLAVVFGYSCHNTTLQGSNYEYHGDYAGVAQAWLEERFPGAVALFVLGTAGDANPYPRGTRELAEEHGRSLARSVDQALTGPLTPINGSLDARFETVRLAFQPPPSRRQWEELVQSDNPYRARHARAMLDTLDRDGALRAEYDYPIQIWRLGDQLTLVGLAGEVVVDYGLRLRRELSGTQLWVAGYSNDVFAYIPSARVLREGGYEAEESMIYYGQPGPFASDVEERIVSQVHAMWKALRH